MSERDFRDPSAQDEAARAAEADEQVTGPDAGPVDPEAVERAEGLAPSDDVKRHYRESAELGAQAQGEGRVP